MTRCNYISLVKALLFESVEKMTVLDQRPSLRNEIFIQRKSAKIGKRRNKKPLGQLNQNLVYSRSHVDRHRINTGFITYLNAKIKRATRQPLSDSISTTLQSASENGIRENGKEPTNHGTISAKISCSRRVNFSQSSSTNFSALTNIVDASQHKSHLSQDTVSVLDAFSQKEAEYLDKRKSGHNEADQWNRIIKNKRQPTRIHYLKNTIAKDREIRNNDNLSQNMVSFSPLTNNLKLALCNLNTRVKSFSNLEYDLVYNIAKLQRLSDREILVYTKPQQGKSEPFILHNGNNSFNIDKYSNRTKVAINSKCILSINDDTKWCLKWQLF